MRDPVINSEVQTHSLGFVFNKKNIWICWFGLASFIFYFIVYIADVASFNYESSNSPAKHFVMVGVAIFSFIVLPVQVIYSILIFLPLVFIYLLGNLPAYAIMVIVLAAAVPLLGFGIYKLVLIKSVTPFFLIFFLALLPAILAYLFGELDNIYSDHYGRPRLLLGYFHPKEAAACFAIPFFLYLFNRDAKNSFLLLIIFSSFLWLVGSRNIALVILLAYGVRFYITQTFFLTIAVLILLTYFLLIKVDFYYTLDELLSFRLSVWESALKEPPQANISSNIGGYRFSIDSFYVEVFSISGVTGVLILAMWVIAIGLILIKKSSIFPWSFPIFLSILFFAAFDSGIASTGNVFHIFSWAIVSFSVLEGLKNWTIK
jgi:hypothetical protein